MSILYWIFGVEAALRRSMPWLSVHDEGLSRGWSFVLALFLLGVLLWIYRKTSPHLDLKHILVLAGLRWGFFLLLFIVLVHPVLFMSGEEVAGLPEMEKIDLASSLWVLAAMILVLCAEWWFRRSWRLK